MSNYASYYYYLDSAQASLLSSRSIYHIFNHLRIFYLNSLEAKQKEKSLSLLPPPLPQVLVPNYQAQLVAPAAISSVSQARNPRDSLHVLCPFFPIPSKIINSFS